MTNKSSYRSSDLDVISWLFYCEFEPESKEVEDRRTYVSFEQTKDLRESIMDYELNEVYVSPKELSEARGKAKRYMRGK